MSTDYRAELQRLLRAVENDVIDTNDGLRFQAAVNRARAALAQSKPEGVGPITDGRPMNQSYWLALLGHDAYAALFQSVDQYRSALIERASSPRAQPEPAGPSHWDVCQRLEQQGHWGDNAHRIPRIANMVQGALTRYTHPAIEPVPVAERLPGPEDCDAKGRCWWFSPPACGPHKIRPCWTLDSEVMEGDTHWLPHNALPVPGAEVPPMPELRAASAEAPPAGRLGWGLVERVADVFLTKAFTADDPVGARAAIRELAAWLSEHTDDDASAYWATRLELEADRG